MEEVVQAAVVLSRLKGSYGHVDEISKFNLGASRHFLGARTFKKLGTNTKKTYKYL